MALTPGIRTWIVVLCTGFVAGLAFSYILGDLDPERYLIKELTLGPVEIPFIVLTAVCTRKYGWLAGFGLSLFGGLGSAALFLPGYSATPVIYLKAAVTGVIIGERGWFRKTFTSRLIVASLPGFILAFVFGLPLMMHGVSHGMLEDIRKEALGIYTSFMAPEDAKNAADNALMVMKGLFTVGFAVFTLSSIILSWLAFIATGWILRRMKGEGEPVPPFSAYSLPFHVIWVFLVSFGLMLLEFKPLYTIALNVCLTTAVLYGVQGMAIVAFHMNRASMGRFPRVMFWLMFFITLAFSGVFLVCTGIIDNWYSLRPAPSGSQKGGNGEGTHHETDS